MTTIPPRTPPTIMPISAESVPLLSPVPAKKKKRSPLLFYEVPILQRRTV